jgi:fructose-1,6-bisphosphatase/inositol monophosphatase family enzyme
MKVLKNIRPIIERELVNVIAKRAQKKIKPDNSYVSEGDLHMDQLVADFVKANYSSVQLVSEESSRIEEIDLTASEYVVTVDPIDGTENFVSGLKEWGIGISVYRNGEHYESMMGLPELGEYLFTGEKIERFESRIHGLSSSLTKDDLLNIEEGFEYRIIGCCMYNMTQVVKGSYDKFFNPKGAHSWDILPGLNLALENNLLIEVENNKYNGEFLQPTKKYRFSVRSV